MGGFRFIGKGRVWYLKTECYCSTVAPLKNYQHTLCKHFSPSRAQECGGATKALDLALVGGVTIPLSPWDFPGAKQLHGR